MRAFAVIGAGYGDEGKGLVTDWLCRQIAEEGGDAPVVVRANGGAQAAHTVQLPDGRRHVFHHFGSGTFAGARTHLARDFLVNPIAFYEEFTQLWPLPSKKVTVDPEALVTLPPDMLINQFREIMRGDGRHGSCGWGINETMVRSLRGAAVRVRDLEVLKLEDLRRLRDESFGHFFRESEGKSIPVEAFVFSKNDAILEKFLENCHFFLENTEKLPDSELHVLGDTLVFEGAQGLGLDQDHGHFPYVTRSSTGMKNPLKICRQNNVTEIEALYVTRAYATRHGAGPLEHEGESHGCEIVDLTNEPNKWQGTLRSAPLDIELTGKRIARDACEILEVYPDAAVSVVVTCVDQIKEEAVVHAIEGAVMHDCNFITGRLLGSVRIYIMLAGKDCGTGRTLMSAGPTHETMIHGMNTKGSYLSTLEEMANNEEAMDVLARKMAEVAENEKTLH